MANNNPSPPGPKQNAIIWPAKYTPGLVDNWVSNEVIESGLSAAADIWPLLTDITQWETYYDNCSQIAPPPSRPSLQQGNTFKFATFSFPQLTCSVEERVEPSRVSMPGRLAWRGWLEGAGLEEEEGGEAYHAWLVEDLEGGRVRILTQEGQLGKVAKKLRDEEPKKMLNGHQDWLLGLVKTARAGKA